MTNYDKYTHTHTHFNESNDFFSLFFCISENEMAPPLLSGETNNIHIK